MPFSYQVTNFTGHGGGIQYRYLFLGQKLKKTEKKRETTSFVPSTLLAANECHGIMANVRWIVFLTVQMIMSAILFSLL